MHNAVKPMIVKLNDAITNNLLDKIKDKKIIVDISGGHDTRVNVSILLNKKIDFTGRTFMLSKGDIPIAKKIAKEFKIPHIITKERFKMEKMEDFNLQINGGGYSEIMCALHKQYMSYNMIKKHYFNKKNNLKRYSPVLEKNVYEIIKNIPIIYLSGGIIQKELIALNKPELLKFPFTFYDLRHQMMNIFYPSIADIIFNSYYRGKGRNYNFDNKKEKGKWWVEEK
jgi:mRNA-degrading endonuclease HigB of HigAB toxin-antitoxin module